MIEIKASHKNRLHAALGIAAGKPISTGTLMKHKNSKSAAMRKMVAFALAARKWKR